MLAGRAVSPFALEQRRLMIGSQGKSYAKGTPRESAYRVQAT